MKMLDNNIIGDVNNPETNDRMIVFSEERSKKEFFLGYLFFNISN